MSTRTWNRFAQPTLFATATLLGLLAAACGMDGVVGGACRAGYVPKAGACVAAPEGPLAPIATSESPTIDPGASTTTLPSSSNPPEVPATPPAVATPPELACEPPLALCRGLCISVERDPSNCGACGRICPSNICVAGECQGATPGDIVLIGHDMGSAWSGSVQGRVLVNAASIPTTDPIRILSFEAGVSAAKASATRQLLAAGISRRTEVTIATPEALESASLYAYFDVVLVHGAENTDAATLGARWAQPLQTFTRKGGVFIALDGGGASNVPELVTATGLISVGAHALLAEQDRFFVTSASDVVGAKLLSPYAAFGASVGFASTEEPGADVTWVVRGEGDPSLPTVIHKTAR